MGGGWFTNCGFFTFVPEPPGKVFDAGSETRELTSREDDIKSQGGSTLPTGITYSEVTDLSVTSGSLNVAALGAGSGTANPSCATGGYGTTDLDQVQAFASYFCQVNDGVEVMKVSAGNTFCLCLTT